jgi:hypothetical protein
MSAFRRLADALAVAAQAAAEVADEHEGEAPPVAREASPRVSLGSPDPIAPPPPPPASKPSTRRRRRGVRLPPAVGEVDEVTRQRARTILRRAGVLLGGAKR